jgi:hypothetical protein
LHKPSETNRAKVIALVTNGARQDRIAEHLEIDAKALRKHYARELEFDTEILLSKVLNNLASNCDQGARAPGRERGEISPLVPWRVSRTFRAWCRAERRRDGLFRGVRERILARIAQINGPPDSDNAREIIAGKLAQLAARNGEIGDFDGPVE